MAAIDKLYLKNYFEFRDLVDWSIVYYPKLLLRFYDWRMSYEEYLKRKKHWVKSTRKHILMSFSRLGKFKNRNQAVSNLIQHYKLSADYDCPLSQAQSEVDECIADYQKSNSDLENEYSFPVCNLTFENDLYLKWHCPLPGVREYLHKQCGVNPKWEWFYKLWWKGKKEFL